eukprot:gene1667-437_t
MGLETRDWVELKAKFIEEEIKKTKKEIKDRIMINNYRDEVCDETYELPKYQSMDVEDFYDSTNYKQAFYMIFENMNYNLTYSGCAVNSSTNDYLKLLEAFKYHTIPIDKMVEICKFESPLEKYFKI